MIDDSTRIPIIVSKWALGEPEVVLQEELTESLLLGIVLENANMTIEGVQECMAVGRVVRAGPFCYQVLSGTQGGSARMKKDEVVRRLCSMASVVGTRVFHDEMPHDCFCGATQWSIESFRFEEPVLDYIEAAVAERMAREGFLVG